MKVLDTPRTLWKLRELMARHRQTNAGLAQELASMGMPTSPATVSMWKNSDEMPLIDGARLAALCWILKCSRDELLGEDLVSRQLSA